MKTTFLVVENDLIEREVATKHYMSLTQAHAGFAKAARDHLPGSTFKPDANIFGGYYVDKSGRCLIAR